MNLDLGIRGLLADYRSGARAPADVIRGAWSRARASDQPAWIRLLDWEAIAEYLDRLGRPSADLPLYGIPFAIKDNIDLAGVPTTAGCAEFARVPQESAFVVERLIAAGAIPLGKTNMDQFATGLVGTRTPYGSCHSVFDERYISGGSSSGSAVAVAAGMVSFALGTDTAGSGRVPAAFNGIVGVKPSLGLLSTRGVLPACRTLDCVSIFALDVADGGLVCAVAAAYDKVDPYSRSAPAAGPRPGHGRHGPRRVGIPRAGQMRFFGDAQAAGAWEAALEQAAGLGWELVEIDFAPFAEAASLLYDGAWIAERAVAVGEFVAAHPEDVDPVVGELIGRGERRSAVEAFRGAYRLAELRRATKADWERIDALLLPTAPTIYTHEQVAADPIATNAALGTYTNFVNLLDLCAVAVPAGVRTDGLPFGITLIARRDQDAELLGLAATWLGEEPTEALAGDTRPETTGETLLAVVGAHLSGLPLNHQLTDLGATLVEATRTAPVYRLYALAGTVPPKPGLVRVDADDGQPIDLEVWRISHAGLGRLIGGVTQPLSIGAVELANGTTVSGFVCDSRVVGTSRDITEWGGWRAFVAAASPVFRA